MSTVESEVVEGEEEAEEEMNSSRTHEIINSESKNLDLLNYCPMS
jgi:hypothetical protein